MVSPGRNVANIVDMSRLKVKLSIAEDQIGKVRQKQPVLVRVDADTASVLPGVVYTVGSKSESTTGHTYPVEVLIENDKNHILKVGMFVRTEIAVRSYSDALTIQKEQLVGDVSTPQVYVVENNIAHLRKVQLGVQAGGSHQVVSGLVAGEVLVSFGQKNLKDGAPVVSAEKK
jgi:RND family efflux transporter MFP subunit